VPAGCGLSPKFKRIKRSDKKLINAKNNRASFTSFKRAGQIDKLEEASVE
jgi:hypothetical protein